MTRSNNPYRNRGKHDSKQAPTVPANLDSAASPGLYDGPVSGQAVIKVVGVGGGGSNAVDRMIEAGIEGVSFVSMNTDNQALANSKADIRLHIGDRSTRG